MGKIVSTGSLLIRCVRKEMRVLVTLFFKKLYFLVWFRVARPWMAPVELDY